MGFCNFAVLEKLAAVGYQLSVISYQMLAVSCQLSA